MNGLCSRHHFLLSPDSYLYSLPAVVAIAAFPSRDAVSPLVAPIPGVVGVLGTPLYPFCTQRTTNPN